MDERILKLKTPDDARKFAANARTRGREDLAVEAEQRGRELMAIEGGFTSPAAQAIAIALYAYEEEQGRLKGRTFRAHRTRQMLTDHGAHLAAERMVLTRKASTGYEVLDGAGLHELSFESIIDRFPDEFSPEAIAAARARLAGEPIPRLRSRQKFPTDSVEVGASTQPADFDDEALAFVRGFRDEGSWYLGDWLPRYREVTAEIASALKRDRPEDVFELIWKRVDNSISNAGQGVLKFDSVDANRDQLLQVIRDVYADGSPANFDHITDGFEALRDSGRIGHVPRLLIARAFAGIHPELYHTTVDESSQNQALRWFEAHTGFVVPQSSSWALRARMLINHLDRSDLFDNVASRNMFPWFVVDQLRERRAPVGKITVDPPRPLTGFYDLPPARRHVALRHVAVQNELVLQLARDPGITSVRCNHPTGTGCYADVVSYVADGSCRLYEVKISDTASDVVRQAMGQLLEYGFRPGGIEPGELFAVGEPALDDVTGRYLARLRADFNINIDYVRIELPPAAAKELEVIRSQTQAT